MITRRFTTAAALTLVSALALTACAGTAEPAPAETSDAPAAENYYPITVTDLAGNEVTIDSAESVALTDNRFFQLAVDWDLPLTVAPRNLMSPNNPLKDDESILNIGNHSEPDFEKIVAADPDLIINGYRFAGEENAQGVADAAPDAAFIDMTANDLSADEYVVESLTLMGEIFNRQAEAAELITEFEGSIAEARAAYDPAITVMGLVTTGKDINYSNPTDGRGSSIFFDLLEMTPALDTDGSTNHQGDDISLEALAGANADFFLVLDRAAAVTSDGGENQSALELITGSASLAAVPAVVNQNIYVMPADYYLTEDVFAYMTVLKGLTESFSTMK